MALMPAQRDLVKQSVKIQQKYCDRTLRPEKSVTTNACQIADTRHNIIGQEKAGLEKSSGQMAPPMADWRAAHDFQAVYLSF